MTLLSNEFLTVRTMNVLRHLNIDTLEQLRALELPTVGTEWTYYLPVQSFKVVYTQRVEDEIKEFLENN
jgi:hypothetical protein